MWALSLLDILLNVEVNKTSILTWEAKRNEHFSCGVAQSVNAEILCDIHLMNS